MGERELKDTTDYMVVVVGEMMTNNRLGEELMIRDKAEVIKLTSNLKVGGMGFNVMAKATFYINYRLEMGEVGFKSKFKNKFTKLEMTELRGYGCQA